MEREFPEQQWLVNSLVPASAITLISGSPGTFKTYTILHMAICLANGEKVFGQFDTHKTGVLIIDEDNEEALRHKRLKQLGIPAGSEIYFTPQKGFALEDEVIDNVMLSCKTYGITVVIIDCLARIHTGDENKSGDMSVAFKKLKRFSENGIAVVICHHNNKKGATDDAGLSGAMRGSSDIFASTDTHLAVTRPSKHALRFVQTKQRYAEEIDPFRVEVLTDTDTFLFDFKGTANKESKAQEKLSNLNGAILTTVEVNGEINQADLLSALRMQSIKTNEHDLRDALNELCSDKKLSCRRGKGKSLLYFLYEEEQDE